VIQYRLSVVNIFYGIFSPLAVFLPTAAFPGNPHHAADKYLVGEIIGGGYQKGRIDKNLMPEYTAFNEQGCFLRLF
jgi:hypothetical protein